MLTKQFGFVGCGACKQGMGVLWLHNVAQAELRSSHFPVAGAVLLLGSPPRPAPCGRGPPAPPFGKLMSYRGAGESRSPFMEDKEIC